MKTIELKRVASNQHCTQGTMVYEKIAFCNTFELPWILNKRNISCIPVGSYMAREKVREDGQVVYQLENVPDRSLIQIHIGNRKKDIKGCICPGEKHEPIGHELAVQESTKAMRELIGIVKPDDCFILKITDL